MKLQHCLREYNVMTLLHVHVAKMVQGHAFQLAKIIVANYSGKMRY